MFKAISNKDGAVTPYEYLPAAAGTYSAGEIVKVTDGKVAKLGAALTDMPQYICAHEGEVAEGENIAVTRVSCDTIYETEFSDLAAGTKAGSKLQVSEDGLGVNDAATGAFEVTVLVDGDGEHFAGSKVRGRFV